MQNEILPLRGERIKHTKSQRRCNTKLDYTSRLMGVNMEMRIFFVSFQTLTETSTRKGESEVQRFSGLFRCSRRYTRKKKHRARQSSAVDQTAERPRKPSVLVTTVSHVKRSLHQTRRENEVPTKTGKNRTNVKLSRGETSVRDLARDVSKPTVKIEIR